LRENLPEQNRRAIKLTFNGTLDEIAEMLPDFARMSFDGAMLARTRLEETPQAIRRLATEIAPSYR
jgi:hypothetical protein